jgi:two-component system, OmpR family, KDP operon response regulator KdpE
MREDDVTRPARTLVVEDEPRLARLVETLLTSIGHTVIKATDGQTAIELAAVESPDLVVLDILLPGTIDGFEVCQRIREFSSVPIIMLTAKAHEAEKLRGFALGADDYVTKPFSARELLARVRAVLRRNQQVDDAPGRIEVDGLVIDLATHSVIVEGEEIDLTPTEYRLLLTLVRNPNRVIPREDLLQEVWGHEYRDQIDYLRTYIRYLRRKLERDPSNPRYIQTRPGVGYQFTTRN